MHYGDDWNKDHEITLILMVIGIIAGTAFLILHTLGYHL
jgi:hypothetical protein